MTLDDRILGYIFVNRALAIKVADLVMPKYLEQGFQDFYNILLECINNYKEVPTFRMVHEHPKWKDEYESMYQNMLTIQNEPEFDQNDLMLDLDYLKNRYNAKVLIKLGKSVFKENWDGKQFVNLEEANKSIRKTVSEIDLLRSNKVYREGFLAGSAKDARSNYVKVRENPDIAKGVCIGLREFDRITNGLRPAELVLIGGESSAGKSALAMNMAINAWRGSNRYPDNMEWVNEQNYEKDGINVVYFTLEMPYDPLERRINANLAGVSLNGIRDGTLTPEEEERFNAATKFQELYDKHFYIVDIPRGCTVNQIEAKYLELLYDFTPQLVVVDYITLMKIGHEASESDWLTIGKLAELLHEFCRTYSIPCITPVQLTRPPKSIGPQQSTMPDQHRAGRSIMLPQNCNIMINIHSRADEYLRPDMEVNIAKMRDGERGSFVLHKRLDMMRIYDDVPGWTPLTYGGVDEN